MSADLFGVPLPGRCLSPRPHISPRIFQEGNRVAWVDGEEGIVGAVTEHAVYVQWSVSAFCWYPIHSIAAQERIVILADRPEAGDLL